MLKKPVNRRPTPTEEAFAALREIEKMSMYVARHKLNDPCTMYMTDAEVKENHPTYYIDVWYSLSQLREIKEAENRKK